MANTEDDSGIIKILNLLEDEEVFKLAATTTQNLIKQDISKNEAIDKIIRHSPDLETILNRKVVRREYLFQYLDERGITVTPPVTKLALINKILKLWNVNEAQGDTKTQQPKTEVTEVAVTSMPAQIDDVNLMATKFSEWFYSILNEDQPIGEEHFWQDCSLKLNLVSESANISNSVDNDRIELANMLYATKCEHGLFFNPNLTNEGVRGKMDNHGLVMVFCCGTLHTLENCVGVFEQMFALARDPFSDNNWKIKHTQLTLRSKSTVSDTPRLADSNLSNEVLPITGS